MGFGVRGAEVGDEVMGMGKGNTYGVEISEVYPSPA